MSESTVENSGIRAVALQNPFTMQRIDRAFLPGMTIAEMLADLDFPDYCTVLVSVDGDIIPQEMHAHYMPRPGQFVTFRAIPAGGGGGKNPLRTVLMIAVIVAAAYVGQSQTVIAALGKAGAAVAAAATTAVGALLVNAIAPPPSMSATAGAQTYKDSPSFGISGGRNVINRYGPIPSLLGRSRIYPPYGAVPYTETAGNDQYLICLFNLGYGPLIISDLKIGETPLSEYADVEYEIFDGSDSAESRIYPGDVNQEDMPVVLTAAGGYSTRTTAAGTKRISIDLTYSQGLLQVDATGRRTSVISQVELQYAVAGSGSWLGPPVTGSVLAPQTIDVPAYTGSDYQNKLLVMDKLTGALSFVDGNRWANGYYNTLGDGDTVWVPGYGDPALFPTAPDWAWPLAQIQDPGGYIINDARPAAFVSAGEFLVTRTAGPPITLDVAGGTLASTMFVTTGKTSSAIRRTYSFPVAEGQYDVRLKRVSADTSDPMIFDQVAWTAIRSFQAGSPITEPNMARVVLRIKATEQLNGIIDTFSCIAQVVCPDYDSGSSTWITRATSNPASLYRHVLQGSANKRTLADAQIDLTILATWHTRCADNGWTFNHYVDYRSSVQDMLQMIAAAGRASPGYVDGKYAVVMDRPQTNIAQHFTPRNGWASQYSKTFIDLPHAFRVKFRNRNAGWEEDERIVYDDGYSAANATKFEELNYPGIDTPELAWVHARYHIACARLQPESYSRMIDFEHLTCTRGDLAKWSDDVIQVGLGYGRVKSYTTDGPPAVNVLTITLDTELTMEGGKTYGLRIRQEDGTSIVVALTTAAGTSATVAVSGAYAVAQAPDIGALAMFGETDEESMSVIVSRIEPAGDLTARITCLPYAPAVHTADSGTIPAFETHISTSAALGRYALYVPVISSVRSDESVMLSYPSGDLVPQIAISFSAQSLPAGLVDRTQVRYRVSGTNNPYMVAETTGAEIFLSDVTEGESYNIEARYFIDGQWSKWCATRQHTVVGQSSPPADVTNFRINIIDAVAFLSWSAVTAIDLAGYKIKYSPLTAGATWTGATLLGSTVDRAETTAIRTALNGTYLIKAIDQSGRESINATSIVNTASAIAQMNVVETISEVSPYAGVMTDVWEYDGSLILAFARDVFDEADFFTPADFFLGDSGDGFEALGYYDFASGIDLGNVYVSRVSGNLTAAGVDYGLDVFSRADWFAPADFFGVADTAWEAEIEMRTTDDDPAGSPTWSDWAPLALGDYSVRGFEFRIRMESDAWGVTPSISAAAVEIDMPDRIVSENDLTVTVAGLSVAFDPAFKGLKGLGIAAQDMATGDYSVISSKSEAGFSIIFRNAAGSAVQRTMDYIAAGYGRVQV